MELKPAKSDLELTDFILSMFYDEDVFPWVDCEVVVIHLNQDGFKAHKKDVERIFRKLQREDFIHVPQGQSFYAIADTGRGVMREHKTYINYINSIKKKEKKEQRGKWWDRRILHGNTIVTILIAIYLAFSGKCNTESKSEGTKTEKETQDASMERGIPNNGKILDTPLSSKLPIADTVKDKQNVKE